MSPSFVARSDGTVTVLLGSSGLRDCYPSIDGTPICPVSVEVENQQDGCRVVFQLSEGTILLQWKRAEGIVTLDSRLFGFQRMPHWFHPLGGAEVSSIELLWRQGFGIAGASGPLRWSEALRVRNRVESHGLLGLGCASGWLWVSTYEHDRFVDQYEVDFTEQGSRIMFSSERSVVGRFAAGFRLERLPTSALDLPTLRFTASASAEEGLEDLAQVNATTASVLPPKAPAYHWCSWYHRYYHFNHSELLERLEGFSRCQLLPGRVIQIDAGYFPSAGDWLETNDRWPQGLKAAFDDIRDHGFEPGIWIGPFMVGNRSRLFAKHPDWVLHRVNGEPYSVWRFYGEQRVWGLGDEEYYVLDTSHPDAFAYLIDVFHTFREWGATFFKTDFLLWGLVDSTTVVRHSPGKTSVEYYRDLMAALRPVLGDAYWLGCIAPFLPSLGFVDGMRIAGDVGDSWDGSDFGPENMIHELVADAYFQHRYWQNDPDVLLLRDFHTRLNPSEIEVLALFQALSGGAIVTSDPLDQLGEPTQRFFRFLEPDRVHRARYPGWEPGKPLVLVQDLDGGFLLFVFNPCSEAQTVAGDLKSWGLGASAYVTPWKGEAAGQPTDSLLLELPSHSARLFFVGSGAAPSPDPENVWTWPSRSEE